MRGLGLFTATLLLFTSTLEGQTPPGGRTDRLDSSIKVAQSALSSHVGTSSLTLVQSERLVRACRALAVLDIDQHDRSCRGNAAVTWSLDFLGKSTTKLPPRFSDDVRSYSKVYGQEAGTQESGESRLLIPKDAEVSSALKGAIVADIDAISVACFNYAERGNNRSRLKAEASLNVLFSDLKEALGSKSSLLPDDPLALAGPEAIDREISSLKAYRSRLVHAATLFPLPDTTATLESVDNRLARLDQIVASNQAGRFHLARDEIEAQINAPSWSRLAANRPALIRNEESRLDREWNLRYPSLKLSPIPLERSTNRDAENHRFPLSARVLEATSAFEIDPTSWLVLESSLLANYAEISRLSPTDRLEYGLDPIPSYQDWRASLLTDQDLHLALMYSKAAERNRSAIVSTVLEVPFAPDLEEVRYRSALVVGLNDEIDRRKKIAAPSKERPVIPAVKISAQSDPENRHLPTELERLYRVKLAEGRYQIPTDMPPLVADLTRAYVNEVHDSDLRRSSAMYQSLARLNEKATLANEPLGNSRSTKLNQARLDVFDALVRLDVLIKAWERKGYTWSDAGKRDLETMIAVLSSRPPPDQGPDNLPPTETGPVNPPRTPPQPSNPATGSVTNRPPLSDAKLLSLFDRASASIREAQTAVESIEIRPSLRGRDHGKITVSEEQLLKGNIDYPALPKDLAEARLPDRLQSWNGFIDPNTKKPYDYQSQVLDFKSLNPVGGGIHFGNRAVLISPTDLHHFILTYDSASKTLSLIGPSNERYTYGPVEATNLKALYRYAASDDNAAVSIGWSGEYVRESPTAAQKPEPVLLDPNFVDTHIGQDLVAADSIPWRLGDSNLPSGIPNPIATPFKAAEDHFFKSRTDALSQFCRNIRPFTDAYGLQLAHNFHTETYFDLQAIALMSTSTLPDAKDMFLNGAEYTEITRTEAFLKKQLELSSFTPKFNYPRSKNPLFPSPSTSGKAGADDPFQQFLNGPKDDETTSTTTTKLDQELKKVRAAKATIELFAKSFDTAPSRLELLEGIAADVVARPPVDSKWIKVLVSVIKARKKIPETDLGAALEEVLPITTLAVLLDQPTQISTESGRIHLTGTMAYRYASTLVRVQGDSVTMTQGIGPKATSVETISELTDLANKAMPTLAADFSPLMRVSDDARLIAFLRWCRTPGNLLSIDLSELSNIPSSDRTNSATPDAINRGKAE